MRFRRKKPPSLEVAFQETTVEFREAIESKSLHDQERAASHMLELASAMATQDQTPEWALTLEAHECEERGDWQGVEAALQKKLGLAAGTPTAESWEHFALAALYSKLGRDEDVLRHMTLGAQAARQIDMPMLRAMALAQEASYHLSRKDAPTAAPLIAEGLSLIESGTLYDTMRAGVIVLRAACAVIEGRLNDAKIDLESSFVLLETQAKMPNAGGVHGKMAYWWDVTSALRKQQGDEAGAIEACEEAVATMRHIATIPQCAGVDAEWMVAMRLRRLAILLKSCGKEDRAGLAFAESQAILEAIGLWEYQKPTEESGR